VKRLANVLSSAARAISSPDAIAMAGFALVALGAWMAWPPAGPMALGAVLILVARTEAN
jgi:hypothetical protein